MSKELLMMKDVQEFHNLTLQKISGWILKLVNDEKRSLSPNSSTGNMKVMFYLKQEIIKSFIKPINTSWDNESSQISAGDDRLLSTQRMLLSLVDCCRAPERSRITIFDSKAFRRAFEQSAFLMASTGDCKYIERQKNFSGKDSSSLHECLFSCWLSVNARCEGERLNRLDDWDQKGWSCDNKE